VFRSLLRSTKFDKPDAQPSASSSSSPTAACWLKIGRRRGHGAGIRKAHQNLDLLLEMIILVQMGNLRANPARPATGNVLEAKLDKGRGP